MKTTIDIADSLFARAKALAARERITLRQLVEEGLLYVLRQRRRGGRFHLRKVTFRGQGLSPDLAGGSWEQLRDRAYEGHGG